MFRVLTVTREYGAGGSAIARLVADQLGWSLLDRGLIGAVARAAKVDVETVQQYDEHVDSWWHRFHRNGAWAAAIAAGSRVDDAEPFDAESVAAVARRVIDRAAARGNCVLVGRGAQCVLRDREDAFHVFVHSPWSDRVLRVRSSVGPTADIEELIRAGDHDRARYIRAYYGCDWKDPDLYHLMVNSRIGVENAARLIVDTVQRCGRPVMSLVRAGSGF